jgi:DNA-binding response OmpR family regulator
MAEILLVDNDARICELVAWFLERRGHRVRSAPSFSTARERILERVPDLMLSDVDLGIENGRDELPKMAREGLLPPTLVVSGYLDRELDARLRAIPGVLDTLAKPFDLAVLEARVASCLSAPRTVRAALPARDTRAGAAPLAHDDGWVEILPERDARGDRPAPDERRRGPA